MRAGSGIKRAVSIGQAVDRVFRTYGDRRAPLCLFIDPDGGLLNRQLINIRHEVNLIDYAGVQYVRVKSVNLYSVDVFVPAYVVDNLFNGEEGRNAGSGIIQNG